MSERAILSREVNLKNPTTEEEIEDHCLLRDIPIFTDSVRGVDVGELEIHISNHPMPESWKEETENVHGFHLFREKDQLYAVKIWLVPESMRSGTIWPVDATNLDWHVSFLEWVEEAALEEFRVVEDEDV